MATIQPPRQVHQGRQLAEGGAAPEADVQGLAVLASTEGDAEADRQLRRIIEEWQRQVNLGFFPDPGVTTSMVGPPDELSGRRLISVPSSRTLRAVSPRGGKSCAVFVSQSQKSLSSSGVFNSRCGSFLPRRNCRNASRTSSNVVGGGRFSQGESAFGPGGAGSSLKVWLLTAWILGFRGGGVGLRGKASPRSRPQPR